MNNFCEKNNIKTIDDIILVATDLQESLKKLEKKNKLLSNENKLLKKELNEALEKVLEERINSQIIKDGNHYLASNLKIVEDQLKELKEKYKGAYLIPKQKTISEEKIKEVKRLHKQGNNYRFISEKLGLSKASISRIINNKYNYQE